MGTRVFTPHLLLSLLLQGRRVGFDEGRRERRRGGSAMTGQRRFSEEGRRSMAKRGVSDDAGWGLAMA